MHQRATLRGYQAELKAAIIAAWASGSSRVLAILPTGAGKTVIFSDIIHDHQGASCAIAHRQELVIQISIALARDHVPHRIIGPTSVVRLCVKAHMEETGKSYYDPQAQCAVAGVDTLVKRADKLKGWAASVTLWVQDEAHHMLVSNKWGKAARMFPNARGLGVTATPARADGKGLGADFDGLFDTMIVGLGMRELVRIGYLADYRIFAPPSDLILDDVTVSKTTGDYNPAKLKRAVQRSRIIGDVVDHYKRIAMGKTGLTFATDVETATQISASYNAAGVPSEVISAKTSDHIRVTATRRLKSGELLQLVNVDIFGEGYDVPGIEVISMARPTASYPLYIQQFGRAMRPLPGKDFGLIIDHVGNVERHRLPDAPRVWSLSRRQRRASASMDAIPVRSCPKCTGVYERIYRECPFCGFRPEPAARTGPEFVDGDLHELTPEVLAQMRGEIDVVDMPIEEYRAHLVSRHVPSIGVVGHVNRLIEHQGAQSRLRESIALWAGHQVGLGRPDSESYRRFYLGFGVDVLSAQALPAKETEQLTERVNASIGEMAQ